MGLLLPCQHPPLWEKVPPKKLLWPCLGNSQASRSTCQVTVGPVSGGRQQGAGTEAAGSAEEPELTGTDQQILADLGPGRCL